MTREEFMQKANAIGANRETMLDAMWRGANMLADANAAREAAESALSSAREEARRLTEEKARLKERMDVVLHAGPSTALAASVFDRAERAESSARRLREALEATATYLAEQEWSAWRSSDGGREDFIGAACCPECGGMQSEGHASASCRLETLLATARAALGSSPVAPSSREGGDEG